MTTFCRITCKGKTVEYANPEDAWAEIARAAAYRIGRSSKHHFFLGVVGSRRRDTNHDAESLRVYLEAYINSRPNVEIVVVSGACPQGADNFAANYAKQCNVTLIEFPAQWDVFGKSAGFKRNEHIARLSDVVVAMVAKDRTGGTENTITHARNLKRQLHIIE